MSNYRQTENPVPCTQAMEQLGIGRTRMSAIKSKMGIANARYVFMSDLRHFMRENPVFSTTEVYPKKANPSRRARPQRATSGKSGGPSLKRARGNGGPSLRERSFSQAPSQP